MSEYITVTERTIEDALTEAKIILGAASDEIEYEVIEKGSNGFLGMGAKNAVIKVRKLEPAEFEQDKNPIANSQEILTKDSSQALKEDNFTSSQTQADESIQQKELQDLAEIPENNLKEEKLLKLDIDQIIESASNFLSLIFNDLEMSVNITADYNEKDKILTFNLSGDEMGLLIGKRGQTLDSLQYLTSLAVNRGNQHYVHIKLDTENYRERRKSTLENLAKNISAKVRRTGRSVALEPMNPYERRIIHYALQTDKSVTTHSEGEDPYRKIIVSPKRR